MPRIDSEKFYNNALKKHGISSQGLNWNSQKNQVLRFDAIVQLLPKELHSFKIIDAGCGFGDFYLYLQNKGKKPKEYIGIDSLKTMQEIASRQTKQKILLLDITKEQIPNADYYICSGALNILTSFETQLFIQNCYNSSKYGFIFNVLHGESESQTYNYLSTKSINALAKSLGVKQWRHIDSYLQNDITLGFFK